MRAGQIIHDSRWIEVEITVQNGRVQATTTTTAGGSAGSGVGPTRMG